MSLSAIESEIIHDIESIDAPFEYAFSAVISKRKRKTINSKTHKIKNLDSSSDNSTENLESDNANNSRNKDLDFSRKNIQHYWFQKEGEFDRITSRWIPFHVVPEYFELPGPVNIYDRKEIELFLESGELERIEDAWQLRWPRISKSMRKFFIEVERTSLHKFHPALWSELRKIPGFSNKEIQQTIQRSKKLTAKLLNLTEEQLKYTVENELKIDYYGNVLSLNSERYSPTGWDVDHIFPHSRGGLSQLGNLRPLLSRANSVVKKDRFEPLIDRKEMLIGVTLDQLAEYQNKIPDIIDLLLFLTKRNKKIRDEIVEHETEQQRELHEFTLLCDHCKEKESKMICKACKQYQFCSTKCHAENWNADFSVHKKYCNAQ